MNSMMNQSTKRSARNQSSRFTALELSFDEAAHRLNSLITEAQHAHRGLSFNAHEAPSLTTLIQREELLMQLCIHGAQLQILIALLAPDLEQISFWVASRELNPDYDEHEDVYVFETSLASLSDGLSCELVLNGARSPRYVLIPASEDS